MVDDGPSEKSQGSCRRKSAHTAVCHRGGRADPSDRRRPAPAAYANAGACLAPPDRTVKIPPGRDPGRERLRGKMVLAEQRHSDIDDGFAGYSPPIPANGRTR
jgi:hypothetical protein